MREMNVIWEAKRNDYVTGHHIKKGTKIEVDSIMADSKGAIIGFWHDGRRFQVHHHDFWNKFREVPKN